MFFNKSFLLFLVPSAFLLACRSPMIDLGDKCLSELNMSYFRGTYPDMTVEELYKILGKPDDEFEVADEEPTIDLAYYNEQGRLLLHWSGDVGYNIGMIEFRPKITITKKDILRNDIIIKKHSISFSCHKEYKLTIFFEKDLNTVKEIHFWHK